MSYIKHLKSLNEKDLAHELDGKIANSNHELIDSQVACDAMAGTNAVAFDVDDYSINSFEIEDTECRISLWWHATGEQDEDKGYCGDTLVGSATVIIDDAGDVSYEDITAEVETEDEPPEENKEA